MQAPAGICILGGPDLTYELVNQHYQSLFPGRALLGKPLLKALPELKGQAIWNVIMEVYNTGKTFEGNGLLVPLPDNNGVLKDCYFNFIYQPRFDESGAVDGILVFAFDVTELIRSKQAIEENEKRFRSMVESSPVAMLVTKGEHMVFETINAPMLSLIGRQEDIRGKAWFDAMPELRGQPIMDILYRAYRDSIEWSGNEQPIVITENGTEMLGY
jgi:PAS domain S-box-containing protein